MYAPWKRAAAIGLASCTFAILPLINGCKSDIEKADESVNADVESATAALESGHAETAAATLQKTQKQSQSGSSQSQVIANTLLAQAQTDQADAKASQISRHEADAVGVIGQMDALAGQIASNGATAAAGQSLNPKAGQQEWEKAVAAAQTGQDGQWIKGEAPIPALATVKQQVDALQKQIAELVQQRTDFASKQKTALEQAEKFDRQADSTSGKDSVGFYTQGAGQRKEAADDQTKIDLVDGKLTPLKEQLAVAQLEQKNIETAVSSFQEQSKQLQDGWQKVQAQIDGLQSISKSLIGGPPHAAGSEGAASPTTQQSSSSTLTALAADLEQNIAQTQTMRGEAVELLTSAWKNLETAQKAGASLTKELAARMKPADARKLPEYRAWQELSTSNQDWSFSLQKAGILGRLARLYADQYVGLTQRVALAKRLAAAFKQAGVEVPPSLAGVADAAAIPQDVRGQIDKIVEAIHKPDFTGFDEQQSALGDLADKQTNLAVRQAIAAIRVDLYYQWANRVLSTDAMAGQGQGDYGTLIANLAHVALMVNDYGWAQFAALQQDTKSHDQRMADARNEYGTVAQANAQNLLPAILPPGIGPSEAASGTTQPAGPTGAETATTSQPAGTQPTTAGEGSTQPQDSADQAPVRAVVTGFADALVGGDQAKIQSLSITDPTLTQETQAALDAFSESQSFQKAAAQKFGAAASQLGVTLPDFAQAARTGKITVTGDSATVATASDPQAFTLKKMGNDWKIAQFSAQTKELTTAADDLKNAGRRLGRFNTIDDFKAAFPQLTHPGPATPPAH